MLTIVGDFAGDGDINVDVSGLNGTSDLLYIDGSVVEVDHADDQRRTCSTCRTRPSADIPLVFVTGDSMAGNFVLGNVALRRATAS